MQPAQLNIVTSFPDYIPYNNRYATRFYACLQLFELELWLYNSAIKTEHENVY